MDALASFQPAVRTWFERRFPEGPTEPQADGWPAIASGHDTLIAAPTGSGETLAAFLVAIDRLYRETAGLEGLDQFEAGRRDGEGFVHGYSELRAARRQLESLVLRQRSVGFR